MKKDKNQDQDMDLFLHKLSGELNRLDAQYDDIEPPSLHGLEQQIICETLRRRRKIRRELLLFWFISLILLSSCLAALNSMPAVYLIVQVAIPLVAMAVFLISRTRRNKEGAANE